MNPNDRFTVCPRRNCMNNIKGECPAVMEWAVTKRGTLHHLVLERCPFFKEKPKDDIGKR